MIRRITNAPTIDFNDNNQKNNQKFSSSLIEEILEKLDMVQIMEEEYDLAFDEPTNKGWWHTNCPLPGHRDSNPSFGVNPELRVFKCFGCQEKGNLLHFVRKVDGLSFNDAVTKLSVLAGVDANSDITVYRALKDIDLTVKAYLNNHTYAQLPGGLSPVEYMRSLAERLRIYENKVNADITELAWVDSIYKTVDEMDINEDHKGMSAVWSSLALEMKNRFLQYQQRTTINE